MKKILFIVSLFLSAIVSAQPIGYISPNENRNNRALASSALNLPGVSTPAFISGQWVRAGAIVYDSTGGNKGGHIWDGSAWIRIVDTTYTGLTNIYTGSGNLSGNRTVNGQNLRSLFFDSLTTLTFGLKASTGTLRIRPVNSTSAGITYDPSQNAGMFVLDEQSFNEVGFNFIGMDFGFLRNEIHNTITPTIAAGAGQNYAGAITGYKTMNDFGGQIGIFSVGVKNSPYGDSALTIVTTGTRGMLLQADNTGFIKFTGSYLEAGTEYGRFAATTGNLGLSTTNPTQKLTVNGQVRINAINSASVFDSVLVINDGVIEARLASTIVASASLSSLTAAAGANSISNGDNGQTWAWNTLTTGPGFLVTSNATTKNSGASLFGVTMQGANANSSVTSTAGLFSNTTTGTTSTNRAASFTASGGTTNQAIYIAAGDLATAQATQNVFTSTATLINIGGANTAVVNYSAGTSGAETRWLEPSGGGSNYFGIKAQAMASNQTYLWPAAVGAAGSVLMDAAGNGTLSFGFPAPTGAWLLASGGGITGTNDIQLGAFDIKFSGNSSNLLKLESTNGKVIVGDGGGDANGNIFVVDIANNVQYFDNTAHTPLVGIGKSTPTVALDVVGDVSLRDVGGLVTFTMNAASQEFTLNTDGGASLDLNGSTGVATLGGANGITMNGPVTMTAYGAGAATFDASGNITSVSDSLFKIILGDYHPGIDAINNLHTKRFKYNALSKLDQNGVYAGFIAQDVERALGAEAVDHNKKTGLMSIQDRAILAAVVTGEQDLYKMIVDLKKQFEDYKKSHP